MSVGSSAMQQECPSIGCRSGRGITQCTCPRKPLRSRMGGNAFLEIDVQLYGRTPLPQTFLWWTNPAV